MSRSAEKHVRPFNRLRNSAVAILAITTILFPIRPIYAVCSPETGGIGQIIKVMSWDSMYPMKWAGVTTIQTPAGVGADTYDLPGQGLCTCELPAPYFRRGGVTLSIWEPGHVIETVQDAWCFPSYQSDWGEPTTQLDGTSNAQEAESYATNAITFSQVHDILFAPLTAMNILTSGACFAPDMVDILGITELDAPWNDEGLNNILFPETVLFASPFGFLTCMADAAAMSLGSPSVFFPLDPLFWCAGTWTGTVYPASGATIASNIVSDSAALAAKFMYKSHRQMMFWMDLSVQGQCYQVPYPIWKRSWYRLQLVSPISANAGYGIGQNPLVWSSLKDKTFDGSNFAWAVFKKRNCCYTLWSL